MHPCRVLLDADRRNALERSRPDLIDSVSLLCNDVNSIFTPYWSLLRCVDTDKYYISTLVS
jgi:hypothetical protein